MSVEFEKLAELADRLNAAGELSAATVLESVAGAGFVLVRRASTRPDGSPRPILGRAFIDLLVDAGVLPPLTRWVRITADVGRVLTIRYEVFGDGRLLELPVANAVDGELETRREST